MTKQQWIFIFADYDTCLFCLFSISLYTVINVEKKANFPYASSIIYEYNNFFKSFDVYVRVLHTKNIKNFYV
mgnify:CR=1 FL=1